MKFGIVTHVDPLDCADR